VRPDTRITEPHFQTTRWSVVRMAIGSDERLAQEGLAAICNTYWYPLYTFLRRSGHKPQDAEDLAQSFFGHLIKNNILASTDPSKGKLRHFLLACLRNHASNERDKANAQKRGATLLTSFDSVTAEERYQAGGCNDLSPDRLFQREWALAMLGRAMDTLNAEFRDAGKAELFESLRPFLGFGPEPLNRYEEISARLGIPAGTLKSHVHRMRDRWREILFEIVGDTLDNPTEEEIRSELRDLQGYV
jgi:RNA polymerase sigma factor (sigma-70 family)